MTRRAAILVWASMLVVPFFFLAVAAGARWGTAREGTTALLFWLTVVVSALNLALSRLLPPRLGPFRSGAEATVLARLLVGWALCEAAAFFPLVAWIVTGDGRLIGVCAADLVGLLLLFPGDRRWARLLPAPAAPQARRVR